MSYAIGIFGIDPLTWHFYFEDFSYRYIHSHMGGWIYIFVEMIVCIVKIITTLFIMAKDQEYPTIGTGYIIMEYLQT